MGLRALDFWREHFLVELYEGTIWDFNCVFFAPYATSSGDFYGRREHMSGL